MNPSALRAARVLAIAVTAVTPAMAPHAAPGASPRPLPPIVFVSRHSMPGDAAAVPGLGPHARAVVTGGRLLRRDPDGSLRELLPPGTMADVSDPSVSPDARRIAFAGVTHPDSAWRIYVCDADGRGLRAVTRTDPVPDPGAWTRVAPGRYDDLDPCWISAVALCFASTRGATASEYADVPATNLFVTRVDSGTPHRITADRNGAEEPAYDPRRGRIVYSRWWFNARMPSWRVPGGITRNRAEALPGDTVNVWQAVAIDPSGDGLRLAAGAPRPRRDAMGYQPCVLADGDLAAVYALNTGLSPRDGPTGVHLLSQALKASRRIAGPVIDTESDPAYGTPSGLAAPAACSPAALPDGRLIIAYDAGARGDFGLSVVEAPGATPTPIVDLPGTLELDPAPLVPWPPGVRKTPESAAAGSPGDGTGTFTFFCRNLFASGPLDTPLDPAPPMAWPLRIRFFATRPLPHDAERTATDPGDTLELVREGAVRPDGSVFEAGLPAGVPMFEQVVDARGLPLATAHGGAQVPGFNYGVPGATVRCVGCHAGHSTLPAAGPDSRFRRFDVAPSAEVSASSRAPGGAGPAAAVDGRTRGDPARTAWIADGDSAEWLTLTWAVPVRVDRVVLHLPRDDAARGTVARLSGCAIDVTHKGVLVARRTTGTFGPGGAAIATGGVLCDRLELRPGRALGSVLGRRRVAFAEVEVIGAFAPEGLAEPAGPRQSEGSPP